MPIQSRYSNTQIESVMQDLVDVLNKHQCGRDLALMVLGNTVTTVLTQQYDENQRQAMAEQFSQAMLKSVK
ncbi:DUF1414 domain-containing protein [Alteromonas facilis]|uniref:DUF1414 domain-containing protein n=1 Tax=Alteromonas facilis TaxID=2048004 RepID=UPI000C28F55B|nr:DUF1414 domain-containing protein [Alteromonas facilis]